MSEKVLSAAEVAAIARKEAWASQAWASHNAGHHWSLACNSVCFDVGFDAGAAWQQAEIDQCNLLRKSERSWRDAQTTALEAEIERLTAERDQYQGGMECADEQAEKWRALATELAEALNWVAYHRVYDREHMEAPLDKARAAGVIR